ncbi:hypothetical protein [Jannaschia seohaensis]|uniref:Polyisoprenoid-binding protein YceI n=1 Tax=Jannaschia seohaensis TaxID=475081 RepID=A0A2Y9AJ83_9RHOB|nr:hypothetical protein [Jannaschia seohaensis]PWJ20458.1 hypothetical protein BCF38_103276 [Jannaschia seohaensis]SSA44554.1 hypothetical protein SAMN05421539_103276 [Jannaschia seohaensis]
MPIKSLPLPALTLGLAMAAPPALAQSTGELLLQMNGEEIAVPLWGSQSDWSGSDTYPSINIYARAFNADGEDPLVVTLGFDAGNWIPDLEEMRVTRYEDGAAVQKLFGGHDAEDGGVAVTLDSHEMEGELLTLTGRVSGALGTSENFGRDIDLAAGGPVEGSFRVTLQKLE